MSNRSFVLAAVLTAAALFISPGVGRAATQEVARATLSNGLRVVVVRNTLAPVATAMLNYEAGSDEQWIPGLAHATEHMMFRGSATLSSAQLMDSIGITGGAFDADTESNVTQYYFTVPSAYLDIALRAERSRAEGLLLTPELWGQERGAIIQEVKQDDSDAFYRLFTKMQNRLIGGTPYAKNTLGTVAAFNSSVTSTQLRKYYQEWYHPNNAVYVIAGNVDPQATIAKVREVFGSLPAVRLPAREPVALRPLQPALYHDSSDQAYTAVLLGYRFPGYDSPDYAAGEILSDVLSSQRSDFGGLAYTGKALGTQFVTQTYPKAGIGIAFGAVPVSTPPQKIDALLRAILEKYQQDGVPADLVQAAKLREISALEFNANSIEGQAFQWSQAVAVQGLNSPDDMIARFDRVGVADVNRVLRTYLDGKHAVVAYAVPKNSGAVNSGGSGLAKENNLIPPSKHQPLPAWAQSVLQNLHVPEQTLAPVDMTLSNGIRLIVQEEHISRTVVVDGDIQNNPQVQEPPGQEGIADLTDGLLPYGTTTYDRVGLQRELDTIAASTETGTSFGLDVLSANFDRGVQLLADEQLHPAFKAADFSVVQQQIAGELEGEMTAPDHLASVALAKALYPAGDPSQRFATPKSIGGLTLDDAKRWFTAAYRPDLTTIVVIGDTTPQEARAVFEKYFGGWTASGPKPNVELPAVPANAPSQAEVPATGRVQSSVRLIETLPIVRSDPAWAPLQVANAVLTGGFYSSLLYHDLREVHGYVYSVESSVSAERVRGAFGIDYACDPQKIVAAQDQIEAILGQLAREPIDPARLLSSKALLMGRIPIGVSSYSGVTQQLLTFSDLGLPLDQGVIDARNELDANAATIQQALAKYVRPNAFVRIVTGPGPR